MKTLDEIIDLIPESVYTNKRDVTSNVYKAASLLYDIFSELATIRAGVKDVRNISTIAGANLELWALDHGLTRDGRTDDELKIRLSSKLLATVNGVTIQGIYDTLLEFVAGPENIEVRELSHIESGADWSGTAKWDGSVNWAGTGDLLWRAFEINLTGVSAELGAAIDNMKKHLKPAGINAAVNY